MFIFQNFDVGKVINEKGCIQAGEEWMERHLLAIASGAVGTAFSQVYFATEFHQIKAGIVIGLRTIFFQNVFFAFYYLQTKAISTSSAESYLQLIPI